MFRNLANKLGWKLMGYPAAIHTKHLNIPNVPGWKRMYRIGARLSSWGQRG